ncbi:hypothetical protein KC19_11G153900 [Ceratodon purpureus]|uniref:Protein kinase domain-containing protein n=1 Tax=Ceratodon purpureus TaxID=3225 RepID=A0A8T0GFF6_CERPU|nr:hypothetical protein KC19_11G153900 [Ceratodon purpureus]
MGNVGSRSGGKDGGIGAVSVAGAEAYSGATGDEYCTAMASTSCGVEGSEYLTEGMSEQQISSLIDASREQGTWSELTHDGPRDGQAVEASSSHGDADAAIWEELKRSHPHVFVDCREIELQVGRVIAEGGQATIYEANWKEQIICASEPFAYVAKVFKMEGFSLADLQRQWPQATKTPPQIPDKFYDDEAAVSMFNGHVFSEIQLKHCNRMTWATFLEDGKFAFVMMKYWGDLRSLINLKVKNNNSRGPPFSHAEAARTMLDIAKGMKELHDRGVLHRDLKAANVLITRNPLKDGWWRCKVADYESSMQVQGTGFWRAPEVLKELLKQGCDRDEGIWTEKVDIYSYAMTCYEVLTGLIPFFGYVKSDWKRVIDGERPHLPDFVDFGLKGLVERCWDVEPHNRPEFDTIIAELKLLRGEIRDS